MPTFDPSIHQYTTATTNATNAITAVRSDSTASVEIKVNGVPVANGASASWMSGENIVAINVLNGAAEETYNIVVTKS